METYRVGVIADTHVPEFLPALPEGIAGLFQGVDLILHAGDEVAQVCFFKVACTITNAKEL